MNTSPRLRRRGPRMFRARLTELQVWACGRWWLIGPR